MKNIAIVQFPGSNTERETSMACKRVGLNPIDFLWNEKKASLSDFDGYIIIGGFSYEDRSRAGILAALDPIIEMIKLESEKGKPVLGICNGAQILVESGLVPGINNYNISIALSKNKRIFNNEVLGVGYYNNWSNLKMIVDSKRSAFTRHFKKNELFNAPFAHGEGRFIINNDLLKKMIENQQVLFQYCNNDGDTINEFPTNPNGSVFNISAVSNLNGNIMAMMPHPERTINGDKIFSSMKEFIEKKNPVFSTDINLKPNSLKIKKYIKPKKHLELIISTIITDNESVSVQKKLNQLNCNISISKQIHWEIQIEKQSESILSEIIESGELFNSNKEFLTKVNNKEKNYKFLIREKDDIYARLKFESLKNRFEINEILSLKHGVLWTISSKLTNFESEIQKVLDTNILLNPLGQECYEITN
ncbi:MAG: phosphoribosylformylglycinamidine synthase I [Candidatus Marinimicrobia bacterium]|nr:phosphoribosylformylglycinamidine synthase I [Candidatus Neomarinimicrobiota bacterium]OUW50876.1 MAG: phosphoribosylformylglycinamidine synthase I [bacterium TMED190]|tara:strand:- start:23891 stop:25150 length:1260 start_codon:yes stop_codon:yes gene_type:complete